MVFESLEEDITLGLDPQDIQEEYQNAIQNHINSLKKDCNGLGVDYVFLDTSESLDQALSYYLLKRKSLIKL
jgi:hypothetical protein